MVEPRFGITRIARVTGLDRCGVEVACAVRPAGHVLQVANGKGLTFADAARRAEAEAAELWAAERVDVEQLRFSSWTELSRRGIPALHPLELGSAGAPNAGDLWSPSVRLAWSKATDLFHGDEVRVPAQALHCLAQNDWPLGPQLTGWTSNGMGAHPRRSQATLHALLEAIERDQLAHALPNAWTGSAMASRLVANLPTRTPLRSLVQQLEGRGFRACLFDLTPSAPHDLGLPVAGALLFDLEEGPIPVTAGYACHLTPERALLGALLEAAQSRLTDVHGAREDVAPMPREDAATLLRWCARARPSRPLARMPTLPTGPVRRPLDRLLRRLWQRGHRRVFATDLAPPSSPLRVVKVIVPSFSVSALL